MNNENKSVPTQFINVQVIATPSIDASSGKAKYTTSFNPEVVIVSQLDTVINYQLVDPTPDHVQIQKITISDEEKKQFSVPSIGQSKKLVTFSDANTTPGKFNVTLYFTDKDQIEFNVDPEVLNEMPPSI